MEELIMSDSFEKKRLEREAKRQKKKEEFEALPGGQKAIIRGSSSASKNARVKDLNKEKQSLKNQYHGVDSEEVNEAMKTLSKATGGKEIYVGTKRSPKSKVKFAQLIQDNIDYLDGIDYLDNKEIVFLWKISKRIGFLSNCIVDNIHTKNQTPLTQTQISQVLNRTKNNVNPIIKSLIDKGIIARSETGLEDNNARAYALFVNPNILFAGDKDDVNLTLRAMFKKVPKELKNLPVKLF